MNHYIAFFDPSDSYSHIHLHTFDRLPWAFWLPESSRWLMVTKGDFLAAREELIRAARWNGRKVEAELEKKLDSLERSMRTHRFMTRRRKSYNEMIHNTIHSVRYDSKRGDEQINVYNTNCITALTIVAEPTRKNNNSNICSYAPNEYDVNKTKSDQVDDNGNSFSNSATRSYRLYLTNRRILKDTLILAYALFLTHMFYYYLMINFAYTENLSMEANFITSGIAEWIGCALGALLLQVFSRKSCMSSVMFILGLTFVIQSVIDSKAYPQLNNYLLVTTNNAIGTLASLMLVFVAMIVNQEVFPTVIRQTGTTIVLALGMIGATLSPFLIHLCKKFDHWTNQLPLAGVCFLGSVLIQFVSKTDDKELADS